MIFNREGSAISASDKYDREIQKFVYMFLPALFDDISDSVLTGFTSQQQTATSCYFNRISTLCAIKYPHKHFFLVGSTTSRQVRKLHKMFLKWNELCRGGCKERRVHKHYDRMQDKLERISESYHVMRGIPLTEKKQQMLIAAVDTIQDAIGGMASIGLKSINRYVERSMDENIVIRDR
jgi:hypothetical protein